MAEITEMHTIPKGAPIYLPGDAAQAIYLLKTGRVRIARLSEDGKQITLSYLEAGNIFGELALLDDEGRHENIAEAVEESLLCLVQKKDFEDFLQRHPELSLKITKWMGFRLKQIENKVEDLVFKSAEERLWTLLQNLARDYPKKVPQGTLITLPMTHQNLGELTNIARPTVTELLKRLEAQGQIQVEKRRIIVNNSASARV